MNIDTIKKNLSYDPETGSIKWIVTCKRKIEGKEAGSSTKREGRRVLTLGGTEVSCSIVAWVLHYGLFPDGKLFHINGDNFDNRICNLDYIRNRPKKIRVRKRVEEFSIEELRDAFSYDPESGLICRISCGSLVKCCSKRRDGRLFYWILSFRGESIGAHRMAWALHHGMWPSGVIDHVDRDGLNNKIENLRDVTQAENLRNSRMKSNNKSGVTGVSFRNGKYRAKIVHDYRVFNLGSFDNLEDAAKARKDAETELGFHENHGR